MYKALLIPIFLSGLLGLSWHPVPERELPEPKPFRHQTHVRSAWRTGSDEVPRDCLGCHKFPAKGQGGQILDPQSACNKCHEGTVDLSPSKPGFAQDLSALRNPNRVFDHSDHLAGACNSCHAPVKGGAGEAGELKMSRGWQTCMACHDPDQGSDQELATRFVNTLNRKLPSTPRGGDARFDHRTHLKGMATDEASCLQCHDGLREAGSKGWGFQSIDESACQTCHVSAAQGTPLAIQWADRSEPSPTKGTFPHGPHVGVQADKDPLLSQKGCFACHDERNGGGTYGVMAKFDSGAYQACNGCHAHQGEGWDVKNEAGVVDHGDVGNCEACHDFGTGPMTTTRPRTAIERPGPAEYVFLSQQHPLITVTGTRTEVAESCRECHRAKGEGGLPSRLGARPFSHDTHLPSAPTDADCTKCHGTMAGAATPADVTVIEESSCKECHKGKPVEVRFKEGGNEMRKVPLFSHQQHLSDSARSHGVEGCVSCHMPQQGGEPTAGILDKALDCTACHNHNEHAARTGNRNQAYVDTCAKCHGPDGLAKGTEVEKQLRSFAQLASGQYHPHPNDRKCTECHLSTAIAVETRGSANVLANLGYAPRGYHTVGRPKGDAQKCDDCHWHEIANGSPPQGCQVTKRTATSRPMSHDLIGYPGRGR